MGERRWGWCGIAHSTPAFSRDVLEFHPGKQEGCFPVPSCQGQVLFVVVPMGQTGSSEYPVLLGSLGRGAGKYWGPCRSTGGLQRPRGQRQWHLEGRDWEECPPTWTRVVFCYWTSVLVYNLSITNTMFEHKGVHQCTWQPGHPRSEVDDWLCGRFIWPPAVCLGHSDEERGRSCQLITTWWWVGANGGGGSWTDSADPNVPWGSVGNVWPSPLSERSSTPTSTELQYRIPEGVWRY